MASNIELVISTIFSFVDHTSVIEDKDIELSVATDVTDNISHTSALVESVETGGCMNWLDPFLLSNARALS